MLLNAKTASILARNLDVPGPASQEGDFALLVYRPRELLEMGDGLLRIWKEL